MTDNHPLEKEFKENGWDKNSKLVLNELRRLNGSYDKLDEKVDNIDVKIGRIDERLNSVETENKKISNKMSSFNETKEALTKDITELKTESKLKARNVGFAAGTLSGFITSIFMFVLYLVSKSI